MRLAVCSLVLGLFVALTPAVAWAGTDDEVRDTLRRLQLSPPMLYPSSLPSRLRDADANLSTEGSVVVSWDRGQVSPEDDNRIGVISLTRAGRGQLKEDLRISRSRGYHPRRVKIGTRRTWRICGHVCGYGWIERNRYYGVYGIYYVDDGSGQTVDRDQRYLIRHMTRLR